MTIEPMRVLVYQSCIAVLFLGACSGDAGITPLADAGISLGGQSSVGGFTSNAGSISTGGLFGIGGTHSTGGVVATGGAPGSVCPSTAPAASSTCTATNLSCFYEDCSGAGRTQATCGSNGTWSVEAAACGSVQCATYGIGSSALCQPGQYCRIMSGGAILAYCTTSTCGQGPVTEMCLSTSGCSVSMSVTAGITVRCNTCPAGSGGCA